MPDDRPFLIVSASGRALAASARKAGYAIAVLDLFHDSDLAVLAPDSAKVAPGRRGGFDTKALLDAAGRLAPADAEPAWGVVYGSGFESRPQLLEALAHGRRLYGNPPDALYRAKDPRGFAGLLDRLGLDHPEIRLAPPGPDAGEWLIKRVGGAGGTHIREAAPGDSGTAQAGEDEYYQRRVRGRAVSAMVLAAGESARTLGLSEQWTAPGRPAHPFRFGGVAAPAAVDAATGAALAEAAERVIRALDLVGLNSVDFILGQAPGAARPPFAVIEVNPRPGAALEVFDRAGPASLFDLHVRAAGGETVRLSSGDWFAPGQGLASAVLYAEAETVVPARLDWPDWAADRPGPGAIIAPGAPICTATARAEPGAARPGESPAVAARTLALRRAEALRATIRRCMQSSSA